MKLIPAILLCTLLISQSLPRCHGYNILILGVHPFFSHLLMLSTIANELATQGHNVTFVTVKATRHHPKLTVINNEDVMHSLMSDEFLNQIISASATELATSLFSLGVLGADKILATDVLQELLNEPVEGSKYDAVLTETYFIVEPLAAGFSQKYNCPLINYHPVVMSPNVAYMVRNPYNPAYMPDYKMPFTNNMTFWQRLHNIYFSLYVTLYQHLIYFPAQDKLIRKHFPGSADWPYISDILRERQSFTLVDAHHLITDSIALAPNVQYVGGLQLKPAVPLPKDISDFFDSHKEHGVIYFAMGSHVNAANLGPARIETLIRVFATLKQGVLWKLDTPDLQQRVSANVKVSTWFPQNDILAHPNCRLFITHGGIHSTLEAIYHGVPMLVVPLFADQKQNGQKALEVGYGEPVDFESFDYGDIVEKVNRIFYEPRYRETVQRMSAIFKSEREHPLQRAIKSIEYVIKHKGAAHLKTSASNLSWYQLFLLDVLGVCFLALVLTLYIIWRIYSSVKRFINERSRARPNLKNKKKKQ